MEVGVEGDYIYTYRYTVTTRMTSALRWAAKRAILTPSLPQPVRFPGTYTPANSIFDGPITNLLSILCILIEILSRAHTKGTKKALMVSNLALLLEVF